MKFTSVPIIALMVLILASCSPKSFDVAFYNVENLFDTIDDPKKRDNDFLPDGKYEHTSDRYWKKIDNIAKVLSNIGGDQQPLMVGLCEVENIGVLKDLANHPSLETSNYQVVHFESPDLRGIDNALFYNGKKVKLIQTKPIHIELGGRSKTRDILMAEMQVGKESIFYFVNHWPSRYGGQEKSAPKRAAAAKVLKATCDSLFAIDPETKIVIMGDLNDYPKDRSVYYTLEARAPGTPDVYFHNLALPLSEKEIGTHYYRGHWGMLDQFIVSRALTSENKGFEVSEVPMEVFKKDWMLYKTKKGEMAPSRFYGSKFYGGYSDHLPIVLHLKK